MTAVTYHSSERLQLTLDENVLIIALNRPEAMNAFDDELHAEFPALMQRIESDGDLRAVVLTGNGKAFSAGGSIDEFEVFRVDFAARRRAMRQARRLVDEMLNLHVRRPGCRADGPGLGLRQAARGDAATSGSGEQSRAQPDLTSQRRRRARLRPRRREPVARHPRIRSRPRIIQEP